MEPIRSTFSDARPCSATLQRALQWASDPGAVSERSLSDAGALSERQSDAARSRGRPPPPQDSGGREGGATVRPSLFLCCPVVRSFE